MMASNQFNNDPLNERELEILGCLVDGLSNREIAAKLFLTYQTVKWYNSQIYSKLGVSNRKEAVEHAITSGLLESEPEIGEQTGKHNLPKSVTEFVGRSQEIHDLQHLIESNQLVTILAPGGMGKTRLSLEVARRQIGRYTDGVFFVALAPLSSPDDIVTGIADNIGFVFHGDNPPARQLINFLKTQELLLILDNFEHLIAAAESVNDIIKLTGNIKIIVTSRERLNLRGEAVYDLRGLGFPTWETPEDAMKYDAVKLFMQSANRVRADFELQVTDLDFLARICRLTAGMPLGIELAAGWVDVLSLEQIANEIQRGIDILETDMRDVPERHRSLRSTFESTWKRLTDGEQSIFARLSVFRGGFTLASAGEVAGATIRDLKRLSQKALIQSELNERYAIHELLRQYAEEHLQSSGDMDTIQKCHAEYFTELIRPLGNVAWGSYDEIRLELTKAINPDFENVSAGWHFYVRTKDRSGLQALLNGIWMYLDQVSRSQEAVSLFEDILSLFGKDESDEIALFSARINARRGWFYCDLGQPEKAVDIIYPALSLLENDGLDDDTLLAYAAAIFSLGFIGRNEEQHKLILRAYDIASQLDNSRWFQFFIWIRTLNYYEMGRYDEALKWEFSRLPEEQNRWRIGSLLYHQGHYQEAEPYLLQARETMLRRTPAGSRHFFSSMLYYVDLFEVNFYLNNYQEAKHYLKQGLHRCDNTTYAWVTLLILEVALDLLIADEKYALAIEIVSCIIQQSGEMGFIRNRAVKHIDQLQASVPEEVYHAMWDKGQKRDLDSLVAELLEELENES